MFAGGGDDLACDITHVKGGRLGCDLRCGTHSYGDILWRKWDCCVIDGRMGHV